MTLRLDHVVIAVHDLEAAIADYGRLGFQVLRGGDHPGRGTHNALVVFDDGAYFELIAWKAPAPQERWWRQLQEHGEGLVDFALLPPDTGAVVRWAAQQGLRLEGPLPGGRVRPDGRELRWETARPATADLPFLCGDLTPRALRVPRGAVRQHPNGARGVASVTLAVRDLDASLARYRALLQSAGGESPVGAAFEIAGTGQRMAFVKLGSTSLVLSSPSTQGLRGPAGLRQRLAARGEGVTGVALRVEGPQAPDAAAPGLAHGARIEFESASDPGCGGAPDAGQPPAGNHERDGVGG